MRLGVVNFLNALPLWDALRNRPRIELVPAMPSALAAMLRAGAIDAGLLPVVEYFRNPRVRLVAGPCVAADGPVESVLLFHRKPLNQLQSLRLDANSRTSNALCQVLMSDVWSISPLVHLPTSRLEALDQIAEDAAVIIGDPAMRMLPAAQDHGFEVIDLAEAWQRKMGLPFIFAAWLVREGVEVDLDLLEGALSEGQARIPEYAKQESEVIGLPAPELERYLQQVIRYQWGDDLGKALTLFGQKAASLGLCEARSLDLVEG